MGTRAIVANEAPWCLRHIEQWQWAMSRTSSTAKRTVPQRQLPSVIPSLVKRSTPGGKHSANGPAPAREPAW